MLIKRKLNWCLKSCPPQQQEPLPCPNLQNTQEKMRSWLGIRIVNMAVLNKLMGSQPFFLLVTWLTISDFKISVSQKDPSYVPLVINTSLSFPHS